MITYSCRRGIAATVVLVFLALTGCSPQARTTRTLTQADRYFAASDYDRAEIEYKNVLQRDPGHPVALARLGAIYQDQGRELRALPFLLRTRDVAPGNLDNRVRLGVGFLAAGKPADARQEALFVLQQQPTHRAAPLLLADATSTDSAEIEDSRRHLTALPEPARGGAPVLIALGVLASRQDRAREAGSLFEQAHTMDPRSSDAASALGLFHWSQQDLPAADAALRQAFELSAPHSPQRLKYAQFKLQTDGAAAARPILQEIGARTPDFVSVWVWLADLAAREKNRTEADAFLARVFSREPQHPPALLLRARIRLAAGEHAPAVADLETLATMFPKSAEIAYQLGLAHVAQGDSAKAASRLSQAIATDPAMAPAVLALAELNIRRRDFAAAIAALQKLASERPDLPAARALLADAHRAQGNLEAAVVIYETLEEQFPHDAQAPFWRGVVRLQQGRRDEARQAFAIVRDRAPAHRGALEQLVELDLQEKRLDAARERLEHEIARDGSRAEPWLLLAKVQLTAGERLPAETALQKAAALDPASPVAHLTLAQVQLEAGQLEPALASVQAAAARNPHHVSVLLLLGIIQERLQAYPSARDAYEKALTLEPKNSLALNNLACLYADHLGQLERAQELAQAVRDVLPNAPETSDTLGWVLSRRGQYGRALPLLEAAAAALPGNPDVQFHLGLTQYLLGQEEAARQTLGRTLGLDRPFRGSDEAREALAVLDLDPKTVSSSAAPLAAALARRRDDPVALGRLAVAYEREGQTAKAIAAGEAILAGHPGHVAAARRLIELHRRNNDVTRAFELAKAARKHAPADPQLAHTLGRLAFDAGDHAWALSLLEEAARRQSDEPEFWCDLAAARFSNGRVAAAEEAMRAALAANGAFPRADAARQFLEHTALAREPAPAAAAIASLERTLATHPSDGPALFAMATLREHQADRASAIQCYENLLQRHPEFTPAQRRLAVLYTANPNDHRRAFELATKARQSSPDDPEIAKVLGIALVRQGNYVRAGSLLQESARKRADDAELHYYLALTQLQSNRPRDGRTALERALHLGLADELAAEARRTLASLP